MKSRIGAALAAAAMFTGSTLLSAAAMADEAAAAGSGTAPAATAQQLQQALEARVKKDAEAMASDAMTAASALDLPLDLERLSPRALVLVSDL